MTSGVQINNRVNGSNADVNLGVIESNTYTYLPMTTVFTIPVSCGLIKCRNIFLLVIIKKGVFLSRINKIQSA